MLITFAVVALVFSLKTLRTVDSLSPENPTSKFLVTREKTLKEIMAIPVSPAMSIPKHVQEEIERMAEEMPYLSKSDLLYNRLIHKPIFVRPHDKLTFKNILNALSDPKFDKETLLFLLGHENPKVRTLAIIGIYQFEDPMIIPALLPSLQTQLRHLMEH